MVLSGVREDLVALVEVVVSLVVEFSVDIVEGEAVAWEVEACPMCVISFVGWRIRH